MALNTATGLQPHPNLRKKLVGVTSDVLRRPFYLGVTPEGDKTYMMLPTDISFLSRILLAGPSGSGKSVTMRNTLEELFFEWRLMGSRYRHPIFIYDSKSNYLGLTENNTFPRDRRLLQTIHNKYTGFGFPSDLINVYAPAYLAPTYNKEEAQKIVEANKRWLIKDLWGVPWRQIMDLAHLGTVLKVPSETLWCLTPETLIITDQGAKRIDQMKKGDMVLTHRGRFRKVVQVLPFPYKGELINVKVAYSNIPLKMTPEHWVLCINPRRKYTLLVKSEEAKNILHLHEAGFSIRQIRKNVNRGYGTVWDVIHNPSKYLERPESIHHEFRGGSQWREDLKNGIINLPTPNLKQAKDLTNLDFMLFPRLKETVPNPVSSAMIELAGWYLSEGSKDSSTTYFWLGKTKSERHYAQVISHLIHSVFGIQPRTFMHKGCVAVRFSKKQFTKFFTQFGTEAQNKHLPSWLLTLAQTKQAPLFKSFIRGDGYINYRNGLASRFFTVSDDLATQFRVILFRLGFVHSVYYKHKERHNPGFGEIERGYEIWICGKANEKFRKMVQLPTKQFKPHSKGYVTDELVWLPIRKIEKESYHGLVYHLEVEEDGTYTTLNGVVHNSIEMQPAFDRAALDPNMTLRNLIGVGGVLEKAAERIANPIIKGAAKNFVVRWRKNRYWFRNTDKLVEHLNDPFSINVLTFALSPTKTYFNQLAFLISLQSLMSTLQNSTLQTQPVIVIHDILNFIGEGMPFKNEIMDTLKRMMAGQARSLYHGYIVIVETQDIKALPSPFDNPKEWSIVMKFKWKSESPSLKQVDGFLGGVCAFHDNVQNFHRPTVVIRPPYSSYET